MTALWTRRTFRAGLIFLLGSTMAVYAQTDEPNGSLQAPAMTPQPMISATPSVSQSLPEEQFSKMRDPFRAPEVRAVEAAIRPELETYAVDSFKLTGVVTGPDRIRAMIVDPAGKTHFVRENMKIGVNGGTVRKIETERVIVREKVINPLGREEFQETEIRLPSVSSLVEQQKKAREAAQESSGPGSSVHTEVNYGERR